MKSYLIQQKHSKTAPLQMSDYLSGRNLHDKKVKKKGQTPKNIIKNRVVLRYTGELMLAFKRIDLISMIKS